MSAPLELGQLDLAAKPEAALPGAKPVKVSVTTRDINAHMQSTYTEAQGYACLFEVANGTGSNANRSADIVLMNLWPSRGMDLNGYEVKTARSDWLRELKQPEKAWPVMQYMDRWFLLAAPGVAKLDEIPSNWGFQEFDGKRVRTLKPAPKLEPKPITKTFLGSLLRRQVRDADAIVTRALREKERELDAIVEAKVAQRLRSSRDEGQDLRDKLTTIRDKTGIDLLGWQATDTQVHALKFALLNDPMASWSGLPGAISEVERALKRLQEVKAAVEGTAP
jgi:hypothetical protein